ncbi:MAG: hypothetical protein M3Y78_08100 [Pseudomonadota bacterium]|nr:hypothetical protein [Pseudomonadota bacterium]
MEFLQAIEQAGPVRLLKVSFVAYPIVNALHIAAIGTLFGSVLLIDLSVLGAIRSVPRERLVALLRRVALAAFVLALLAGLALFSVQATQYVRNPAFLAKLGLIAAAAINFLAFTVLDGKNRASPPSPALRVLAFVSVLLWSGVILAGRFIGFV